MWPRPPYLLVRLHLAAHHPEAVTGRAVVDLHTTDGLRASSRRHPLLTGVIVDHHSGPGLANAGLAEGEADRKTINVEENQRVAEGER